MARIKTFANATARSSILGGLLDPDDLRFFIGAFLAVIVFMVAEKILLAVVAGAGAAGWFIFRASVPRHYPWAALAYWRGRLKGQTLTYATLRRKI